MAHKKSTEMSNKGIHMTTNLHKAKQAKQDEFYTQLTDIENELRYYWPHFKDKVVYLNCDDPTVSNFWFYFERQFAHLGLKKLIATCYKNRNPDMFSRHDDDRAVCLEYSGTRNATGIPDGDERALRELKGNGDFRSTECVELLKQADIVVTNPPFSLFREYVTQLMEYEKQFLIIGHKNAITYKEIFPLIQLNRIWLGINPNGRDMLFDVPDDYAQTLLDTAKEGSAYRVVDGVVKGRLGNAAWYTNLDHSIRTEELILHRRYSPEQYPKYDNYDAIEVGKIADIPCDYPGAMGVPITFLDKYNPEQFEIIKFRKGDDNEDLRIGDRCPYFRIVIRNRRL